MFWITQKKIFWNPKDIFPQFQEQISLNFRKKNLPNSALLFKFSTKFLIIFESEFQIRSWIPEKKIIWIPKEKISEFQERNLSNFKNKFLKIPRELSFKFKKEKKHFKFRGITPPEFVFSEIFCELQKFSEIVETINPNFKSTFLWISEKHLPNSAEFFDFS